MNLWIIFITGLTVGGLTCLAVQGGLLASLLSTQQGDSTTPTRAAVFYPTLFFLIAKILTHAALGFLLGSTGGTIGINQNAQIIMQGVAGVYMITVALNLLNVHPIFRYAIIQPPRFLTRLVKQQTKSTHFFAPLFLGAMTMFIPCGTTLAMEALAISSASGLSGMAIMTTFILGTTPLFLGVGILTSLLGETFKTTFYKIAAVLVLYLGIQSINGSLVAIGSPITIQSFTDEIKTSLFATNNKLSTEAKQQHEITITSSGYSPNHITVAQNSPVTITLISKDAYNCALAFRIPSLGISKNLQPNDRTTIHFTPQKKGSISFSCSMGMYSGIIEVI